MRSKHTRLVFALTTILACTAAEAVGAPRARSAARRQAAAAKAFGLAQASYRTGQATIEVVYAWSRRMLEAAVAAQPKQDRPLARARYREHQARMTALAKLAQARYASGAGSALDKVAAEYFVAEADDWLGRGATPAGPGER